MAKCLIGAVEGRFTSAHRLRIQSSVIGKAAQLEHEAGGHMPPAIKKLREGKGLGMLVLTGFLLILKLILLAYISYI